jgi:hypothetical protein
MLQLKPSKRKKSCLQRLLHEVQQKGDTQALDKAALAKTISERQ